MCRALPIQPRRPLLHSSQEKKTGASYDRTVKRFPRFFRSSPEWAKISPRFLAGDEPLPDTVLTDLAAQRGRAIADFIAQTGTDPGHVEVGKTQAVEDGSKPIAATLALEAA